MVPTRTISRRQFLASGVTGFLLVAAGCAFVPGGKERSTLPACLVRHPAFRMRREGGRSLLAAPGAG